MEKIVTTLFELVVNNKSTTPLFILLAGAVAFWAISGGASNLFGAPGLKELETSHLKYKKDFEVCAVNRENLTVKVNDLQSKNSKLENMNELLKLFLANQCQGKPQQFESADRNLKRPAPNESQFQ